MRALVVVVLLAGCAAQPVPYYSQNEIPRGPGLLSGAEGAFVLRPVQPGDGVSNAKGPATAPR